MKKNEWFLVLIPIVIVWYLDQITKTWALSLDGFQPHGLINFSLHYNRGAMLGLFSNLPPILRTVTLSTGGAFLVCTYVLIQYLLPVRTLTLRVGMSILLGGILGNVTDRVLRGHVIDFIIVQFGSFTSPVFNVSDALQWIGYAMIMYIVLLKGHLLWPDNNARKHYWVNRKFQLKYCFLLLGIGFAVSLISLVFTYSYLRVTIIDLAGENQAFLEKYLEPFLLVFSTILAAFSIGLFVVGKIMSHKVAGPLYAFEKYLNNLIEAQAKGESIPNFKLRTKDEFKELEDLAVRVKTAMTKPPEHP